MNRLAGVMVVGVMTVACGGTPSADKTTPATAPAAPVAVQVGQENVIVAGLLDGPWGEIARQIAAAAIEGITEVLQQVQAGKAS